MVQMGLGTLENEIGVPGFLEKKLFFGKFSQNFWFCLGFWKIRQLATFSDLAGKHLIRSVLVSAPHRGVSDLITPKNKRVMTIFLRTIPQSHISMYFEGNIICGVLLPQEEVCNPREEYSFTCFNEDKTCMVCVPGTWHCMSTSVCWQHNGCVQPVECNQECLPKEGQR